MCQNDMKLDGTASLSSCVDIVKPQFSHQLPLLSHLHGTFHTHTRVGAGEKAAVYIYIFVCVCVLINTHI